MLRMHNPMFSSYCLVICGSFSSLSLPVPPVHLLLGPSFPVLPLPCHPLPQAHLHHQQVMSHHRRNAAAAGEGALRVHALAPSALLPPASNTDDRGTGMTAQQRLEVGLLRSERRVTGLQ